MKINIGYSVTSLNKTLAIEDENKLRPLYDKRIGQEVEGDAIADELKGYVLKITGGCDKAGFPMKQGVLTTSRVRLLIPKGELGFQRWRGRAGERRRKSVRGCIVSGDIAVVNMVIVKKGEKDIEGLTDNVKPRTLGPKRATKLRKLFNLSKKDDVRKFVIKHKVTIGKKTKEPTIIQRGPKIQRLVTPERLRRQVLTKKRTIAREQKRNAERAVFDRLIKKRKAQSEEEKNKKAKVEKKEETKKVETKKVETKKVEQPKKEEKKVEKKEEKKPETKKVETKKVEQPKKEEKKVEKKEEKKSEKKPETKKTTKK